MAGEFQAAVTPCPWVLSITEDRRTATRRIDDDPPSREPHDWLPMGGGVIDQERLEIVQDRFVQDARDVGDPDAAEKLATREDPFAPGAAGAVGAGGCREFVVKGAQARHELRMLNSGQPWDRESSV